MIAPSATRRLTERRAETSAPSEPPSAARPNVLTQHGRQVLTLIGSGLSNAEAPGRLFLSEATVKAPVSKIHGHSWRAELDDLRAATQSRGRI